MPSLSDSQIRPARLDGVWLYEQQTWPDDRGFFREAFRVEHLERVLGRPIQFLQMNHSRTARGGLRGLHAENWEKLVYVCSGEVFIVLADIRPDSPTFGQAETFHASGEQPKWIFIPRGVAHGYCVLSDVADYIYQVTAYYDASDQRAVAWDDPDLGVSWPIQAPILSDRDAHNPTLRELFPDRFPAGASPSSMESVSPVR